MSGLREKFAARKSKYGLDQSWMYVFFVRPLLPNTIVEGEDGQPVGFTGALDFNPDWAGDEVGTVAIKPFRNAFLGGDKNKLNADLYPHAQAAYQRFQEAFGQIFFDGNTQNIMFGNENEQWDKPYSLAGRAVHQIDNMSEQLAASKNPQDDFEQMKANVGNFKSATGKVPKSQGTFEKTLFQSEAIKTLRSLVLADANTSQALADIRSIWQKLSEKRIGMGRKAIHGINKETVYNLFLQAPMQQAIEGEGDGSEMNLDWTYHQFRRAILEKFDTPKNMFEKLAASIGKYLEENNIDAASAHLHVADIQQKFGRNIQTVVLKSKSAMYNKSVSDDSIHVNYRQRGTMDDPETKQPYKAGSMHEYVVIDILSIYGYRFTTEWDVERLGVDGQRLRDYKGNLLPPRRVDFMFPDNHTYLEVFGGQNRGPSSKKVTQGSYAEVKKEKMLEWKDRLYYIDPSGNDALFGKNIDRLDRDTKRTLLMYCDMLDSAASFDSEKGTYTNTGLQGNTNHKDQFTQRFSLIVGQQNEIAVNFYRLWANESMGPEELNDYVSKVSWMRSQGTEKYVPSHEYFDVFKQNPDVVVPREQMHPNIPEEMVQRSFEGDFAQNPIGSVAEAFDRMVKEAQMQDMVNVYNIPGLPKMNDMVAALSSGQNGLPPLYGVDHGIYSEFEIVAMYFQTIDNLMPYIQKIINQLDQYMQQYHQPVGYVGPEQFQQQPQMGIAAGTWTWEVKTAQRMGDTELTQQIRDHIKRDPFFQKLFAIYGVDLSKVDTDLECQKADLGTKNAKNKGNVLYFNYSLFEDGDFFSDGIHYIVHEMTHWLTNQREEQCYFADPEEMQAFTLGIAYEIFRGLPKKNIHQVYFPIIDKHFACSGDAKELFAKFYTSALKMQEKFR